MVPQLMETFNISAHMLGYLSATYYFTYAPMQIPVGVLLDQYGPRRLLITATLICASGGFLFGTANPNSSNSFPPARRRWTAPSRPDPFPDGALRPRRF